MVPDLVKLFEMRRPLKWFSKVVLPAPEAPIILMNYPGSAHPLTPSKIIFEGPVPFLQHFPGAGSAVILMSLHEI
jgi:hypothetical protein